MVNYRTLPLLLACAGIIAAGSISGAIGAPQGKGQDRGGPGKEKAQKQHHHKNAHNLLGAKIHQNGKHMVDKFANRDVTADVMNNKVVNMQAGELMPMRVKTMMKMADANAAPQRLSALAQVYARVMGTMPVYPMPASADADPTGAEIAYLESELKEHYPVSDAQRAALAKTRAEAVQGAIVGESAVAPERVFLSERESGKAPNAGTARMELTLQ